MSKYTTELRYLLESCYDLGLKDYPIFSEEYREHLNNKILNHYKFREIGFETAALFKHYLNTRMFEIMPFYNQLYKSEKIKIEPLLTKEFTESYERNKTDDTTQNVNSTSSVTSDGTEHAEQTGTTTANDTRNGASETNTENNGTNIETQNLKRVESDTPQGLLSIASINDEVYASKAAFENDSKSNTDQSTQKVTGKTGDTSEHTSNTTNNSDGTNHSKTDGTGATDLTANTTGFEKFVRSLSGFEGITQSEMLMKYRETFLNIDMLIINELGDLFLNLY